MRYIQNSGYVFYFFANYMFRERIIALESNSTSIILY